MDVLVLHPKKKKLEFLSFDQMLSDSVIEVETGDDVTIHQKGKNQVSIMGRSSKKPHVIVQSHGTMSCDGNSCTVMPPTERFVPSKKAMQSIEISRKIVNHYLSSIEGYIDKQLMKKKKKIIQRAYKDVNEMKISHDKKKFMMEINGNKFASDEFLVDPIVVDSMRVNKPESSINIKMKDASCMYHVDQMETPSKKVTFCSDSTRTDDAYRLKSYLSIYKEQMNNARSVILGNKVKRIKVGFSGSSTCRVQGNIICCKQGDDENEICY